ncbi:MULTISPECIES: hypothetical protein [unclassified Bradyrhizobium]|uniref:hypothetical protein n=1 Tax=unclassified Bradyrhizobium TaxID=2631580 RepID=UPI00291708EA|nr:MULTISPECIES: hypothetical protein [unclassified Bradyrhizobium]
MSAVELPSAFDEVIIHLWQRERRDTLTIARVLRVAESVVANRLARLRDAGAL